MSELRLQQNFRGCRAHFLVHPATALDVLAATLERLGVEIGEDPSGQGPAIASIVPERDLIFVDGDLETPFDVPLTGPGRLPPAPVIGLIGVEAPSRLKTLVNAGATAFLRKPVHGATVYSALFMGVNEFLRRRDLDIRLQDHEKRRRGRRYVVKAILLVMEHAAVDDDEAYSILRRACMKARTSLEDYCESFVRQASATAGRHSVVFEEAARMKNLK